MEPALTAALLQAGIPLVVTALGACAVMWYRVQSLSKRLHIMEKEFKDHLKESVSIQSAMARLEQKIESLHEDIKELRRKKND